MADVTVAQFAEVLKVPVDRLLQQLDQAGIKVDGAEDMISEDAKHELLTHLRRSHGHDESQGDAAPRKITLRPPVKFELLSHHLARMRDNCRLERSSLLIAIHGCPQLLRLRSW